MNTREMLDVLLHSQHEKYTTNETADFVNLCLDEIEQIIDVAQSRVDADFEALRALEIEFDHK